jgi:hypothetical protein
MQSKNSYTRRETRRVGGDHNDLIILHGFMQKQARALRWVRAVKVWLCGRKDAIHFRCSQSVTRRRVSFACTLRSFIGSFSSVQNHKTAAGAGRVDGRVESVLHERPPSEKRQNDII